MATGFSTKSNVLSTDSIIQTIDEGTRLLLMTRNVDYFFGCGNA